MVDSLYLQLHKLSQAISSEESVDNLLTTLWKTRRTGLASADKSRFQSLLNLPSVSELDQVLACLRSVIRKCAHDNLSGDELLKLFPPDLSLELQSMLLLLLQKHQSQWREETLKEQHLFPGTGVSSQVKASFPPLFTSLSSEISTTVWPCENDLNGYFYPNIHGNSVAANSNASYFAPISSELSLENLDMLPCLKSMTWTLDNRNSTPANRVAIITLKLQNYALSPSGETQVKFQLTRETLEAILRSMNYINEQLSSMVGTSSGPAQKKQKH